MSFRKFQTRLGGSLSHFARRIRGKERWGCGKEGKKERIAGTNLDSLKPASFPLFASEFAPKKIGGGKRKNLVPIVEKI